MPMEQADDLFAWAGEPILAEPTAPSPEWPVKVSMGLGVNSVAMVIGMKNRGERIDAIVFADTGSERPETYAYIPILREWLAANNLPDLTIVKNASPIAGDASLYDECHRKSVLPSPAYGGKSCSLKWKVEPQRKWANTWPPALAVWKRGGFIMNCIGYDNGKNEHKRAENGKLKWPKGHWNRYPLQEWGCDREACVEVIREEGIVVPIKSACFMCPNCKKPEIDALAGTHPELASKAMELETRATERGLRSVVGLGRRFAWTAHLNNQREPYHGERP